MTGVTTLSEPTSLSPTLTLKSSLDQIVASLHAREPEPALKIYELIRDQIPSHLREAFSKDFSDLVLHKTAIKHTTPKRLINEFGTNSNNLALRIVACSKLL